MFGLGPATRIYLAAGVTDMRQGVRRTVRIGPGSIGVRASERTPVLVLQRPALPVEGPGLGWKRTVGLRQESHEELSLLLGGIELTKTKHKRWYRKASPEGHAAA